MKRKKKCSLLGYKLKVELFACLLSDCIWANFSWDVIYKAKRCFLVKTTHLPGASISLTNNSICRQRTFLHMNANVASSVQNYYFFLFSIRRHWCVKHNINNSTGTSCLGFGRCACIAPGGNLLLKYFISGYILHFLQTLFWNIARY